VISVVVPVYRNAGTLRELTARLDAVLGPSAELVFVDDASPDDSAEILRTLERVHVVQHASNRGQNAAVLTGLAHARGDTMVVLDADLQDPPEAIPALLEVKRNSGAAIAFASRTGTYAGRGRSWTSRVYKRLLSALTSVPDGAGLFVAIDRDAARRLVAMESVPSIVAALGLLRMKTVAMPVPRAMSASSAYSGIARLKLACRTIAWVLAHR
jgi:polyisoprenyl-phosphate glycosyltransferase